MKVLVLFVDMEVKTVKFRREENQDRTFLTSARRRERKPHVTHGEYTTLSSIQDKPGAGQKVFEGLICLALAEPSALILGLISLQPRRYGRLGFCILNYGGAQCCPWEDTEVLLV